MFADGFRVGESVGEDGRYPWTVLDLGGFTTIPGSGESLSIDATKDILRSIGSSVCTRRAMGFVLICVHTVKLVTVFERSCFSDAEFGRRAEGARLLSGSTTW